MTCSGCSRSVFEAIQRVVGVDQVQVELENALAIVWWSPEKRADDPAVLDAVSRAGFTGSLCADDPAESVSARWSPLSGWVFNVVAGSIASLILMVCEWGFSLGMVRTYHWAAFLIAAPIQVLCGARFYLGAWKQLQVGRSNMDTLVALGSTSAFGFSAWGVLSGWQGHLFFMESASIITFVSLGHWIESHVSARAAVSLRALLNLVPPTAILRNADGADSEVPVSSLQVGDLVVVKPGNRVPIDARVEEGASAVDESMLTGESFPVEKASGASLFAGTMNIQGSLVARVAAVGEATSLAQIISVVRRAQNSRADIQKLGDRISAVFVPIVVMIALATFFGWWLAPESARMLGGWMEVFLWTPHHPVDPLAAAIYHAVAVLIIACPCAMGLATPVAIMAGANIAAERGILIRDGTALEKSGRITSVMFDKTGTLTQGRVTVGAVLDLSDPDSIPAPWQTLAASLAVPSAHPLSQAIAGLTPDRVEALDWEEVRGSGIAATVGVTESNPRGMAVGMGSIPWLIARFEVTPPTSAFADDWMARGATVVGLAGGGRLLGLIALRDQLKPGSDAVVAQLRERGLQVHLLTGDNPQTARAIASAVGIDPAHVHAEVKPEQKSAMVRHLQATGQKVAFVGDGINDAPALEQADLGIAVSRASDVAREAADIILLKSDIHAIPEAIALAQATLRTIKQNLFWAFFYNTAAIPLAALGFLSPIVSAAAMGFSDLIVIGNALRLRRWKGAVPPAVRGQGRGGLTTDGTDGHGFK
jgi:P-type Cu+ transporter